MSRRRYSVNTSSEMTTYTITYTSNPPQLQFYRKIIKVTDVSGTRKAKNFTVSLCLNNCKKTINNATSNADKDTSILWTLVYLPEHFDLNNFSFGNDTAGASILEPNQHVIMSGIISAQDGVKRYTSSLSRNLNSGDTIVLYWRIYTPAPSTYPGITSTELELASQITCAISY